MGSEMCIRDRPVVEQLTRLLLPLLEMLNMTLGGIGGIPGLGPAILAPLGMMTLTRGGRAGAGAFGRGVMQGDAMNMAGLGPYAALMAGLGKKFSRTAGGGRVTTGIGRVQGWFGRKFGTGGGVDGQMTLPVIR